MIIKVKGLPEKAALELNGDDVLIIEDTHNTCQIKLSELSTYIRNGLIDKDSFNQLVSNAITPLLERVEQVENTFGFRVLNVTKALPISLPEKDEAISESYQHNQNNISFEIKKINYNNYELTVTETAELKSYYSGGSVLDSHKWYGVIIEFNVNNGYITYDQTKSSGIWASNYYIDESEKSNVYLFNGVDIINGPQEDIDKTLCSLLVWLRADDDEQTFCFKENDTLKDLKLKVKVVPYESEEQEEDKEESQKTYAVYTWDTVNGCEPDVVINSGLLTFYFNKDIPYTKKEVDGISESGHFVGIKITPPIGFITTESSYPKLYLNGEFISSGWKNFFEQDENGTVVAEDTSFATLILPITETKRNILCTIDWGIGYIDTVVIDCKDGNLLYPPIDNV